MNITIKLFDIYIFLITLFKGLGADGADIGYIIAFCIGCVAIYTKIRKERFRKKELYSILLILLIGILNLVIGHTTTILFTAIAILGMNGIDIRHIAKLCLKVRIVAFSIRLVLSMSGIKKGEIVQFYRAGKFISRYTFGYATPNTAHMALATIIILIIYLYGERIGLVWYALLMIVNFTIYKFTGSRTGFLVVILCVILSVFLYKTKLRDLIIKLLKYAYPALFVGTLIVGYLYGKSAVIYKLDELLTGRIRYIGILLNTQKFPILGGSQYFWRNEQILFDNSYIAMIYQSGLIAFAWISYYTMKAIQKISNEKRYADFFLMTSFILYGVTESIFASVSVNVSLLLLSQVVFDKSRTIFVERNT